MTAEDRVKNLMDDIAAIAAARARAARAGSRSCARCGWLSEARLCPQCGADPDAAAV